MTYDSLPEAVKQLEQWISEGARGSVEVSTTVPMQGGIHLNYADDPRWGATFEPIRQKYIMTIEVEVMRNS